MNLLDVYDNIYTNYLAGDVFMLSLTRIYHPITAAPFRCNQHYIEIPPCETLRPFVRCFWGTDDIINGVPVCDNSVVTPDTCMDIIFNMDYTDNSISSSFCGIDEHSHFAFDTCTRVGTASFGIRFYPWSVVLFSDDKLSNTSNHCFPSDMFFHRLTKELEPILRETSRITERVKIAESLLIKALPVKAPNADLMNSVYFMLSQFGRVRVSDICGYTAISQRQLERIFLHNIGVSPKTFSELIRYQLLWQDMLFEKNFNALDAVEKFGYFDQAHLLNDFKKRHFMTPTEAVSFALCNR